MKVFELFTRGRDARDRQASIRCVADELDISKTSLYEVISDPLGMKKVCKRWVPKFFTPLPRVSRVDCCEERLEKCNQDPTGVFGRIVTGNETWIHYYETLSQQEAKSWNKKPGEKIPIRTRVTRSTGKIIMTIF